MADEMIYEERVSSSRTEAFFWALTILFLALYIWRFMTGGVGALALIFLLLTCIFLFYAINYRELLICLTKDILRLRFGVFTWAVPVDNIESCRLDKIPAVMRYGGAGIHFMFIKGRYRASFNFLEYPRVVIAFKRKIGPVRDISFSTRQPDRLANLISQAIAAR